MFSTQLNKDIINLFRTKASFQLIAIMRKFTRWHVFHTSLLIRNPVDVSAVHDFLFFSFFLFLLISVENVLTLAVIKCLYGNRTKPPGT